MLKLTTGCKTWTFFGFWELNCDTELPISKNTAGGRSKTTHTAPILKETKRVKLI